MTPDQARDEMLAVFKAIWDTTAYAANVVYDDTPGKPTHAAWARVTVKHATGNQSTLGDAIGRRRFSNTGTLWVQVFAAVGDGSTNALVLANAVLRAYRAPIGGTVWYRRQRIQEQPAAGAFNQVNVLVDFTYDDIS